MPKKNNLSSKEYWEKRETYKLKKGLKDLKKIEKELVNEYKKAIDNIGKEISNYFYKYADDNNLSYKDAQKLLNGKEFKEFKHDLKIYGNYNTKKKYYVTPTNKKDKKTYNHPTVKPLNIIENLIINSSKEHDIILDCFMGSGTTGEACVNTNRKFIGIELDNNYFDIASKRIEEAYFNAQNKEGAINEE